MFAHLHLHTEYSLLDGAIRVGLGAAELDRLCSSAEIANWRAYSAPRPELAPVTSARFVMRPPYDSRGASGSSSPAPSRRIAA